MPVVDASVLVEYLVQGIDAEAAEEAITRGELVAPYLIDAEVGHALRKHAGMSRLRADDAEEALIEFGELPLVRAPHRPLLLTAWGLRENVTFYDALYLALAAELDTSLLTFDAPLARAAKKAGVSVEQLRPRR
jgi:predicted nucleic acid-binding protein